MLNFVCRKKRGLKFVLFYTFFTNNLSQKGYCAPSVSKEKSRLEEILARTEWLMQGVRRGMDEMRGRELAIALSQHAAQRLQQPTPSRPVSASPPRSPRQAGERPSSQPPASAVNGQRTMNPECVQ